MLFKMGLIVALSAGLVLVLWYYLGIKTILAAMLVIVLMVSVMLVFVQSEAGRRLEQRRRQRKNPSKVTGVMFMVASIAGGTALAATYIIAILDGIYRLVTGRYEAAFLDAAAIMILHVIMAAQARIHERMRLARNERRLKRLLVATPSDTA